jgi:ubiquinone/menaquinone biosynthesis C-methylase UbiE
VRASRFTTSRFRLLNRFAAAPSRASVSSPERPCSILAAALESYVGPQGAIIGVEQSPDMIAKARARAEQNGWANVMLVNAPAEEAHIPQPADAAVFHFTHDLMQTPAALDNVFRSLKPGARVVATGLKWARWWSPAVNIFVRIAAMRSTTTMAGLDEPWRYLEPHLTGMVIEAAPGGPTYLAYGVRK